MDLFDEILKQASSNSQSASKEIKAIDKTTEQARRIRAERDVLERKNTKEAAKKVTVPAAPPPAAKPKFSIPKLSSHSKEKNDEMGSRIAAFMQKKKEEERKQAIEKQRQKEKLIQMRLQTTFGGKANKKLAKQFGTTPIELQQKYGNDREHEEYLKKLQCREEEEFDRQCTELRGSVMKALERKKAVDKLAPTIEERKAMGHHRVATNKQNSLRHFMKEDSPGPGPSSSKNVVSAKKKPPLAQAAVKKRPPPSSSAIDFSLLMKKAEAIQRGEPPPRSPSPPPLPPPPKKKNCYESLNTERVSDESITRKHSQSSLSRPSNGRAEPHSTHRPTSSNALFKHQSGKIGGPSGSNVGGTAKCSAGVMKAASNKGTALQQKSNHAPTEAPPREQNRPAEPLARVQKTQPPVRSQAKAPFSSSSKNSAQQSTVTGGMRKLIKSASSNASSSKTFPQSSSSTAITPPAKSYLPGDIRYQGPPPRNLTAANVVGSKSYGGPGSSSSSAGSRSGPPSKGRAPEGNSGERSRGDDRCRKEDSRRPLPSYRHDTRPVDRERVGGASMRAKERMILEQRRRREMAQSYGHQYADDDEEVEDEEYDSDMDDFIDDTELDDHLKRRDLEETLRMINPRYDRNRWRMNERMIDDRRMESNFREISREETRSSKIGLMEDIREAQRGNSFAL